MHSETSVAKNVPCIEVRSKPGCKVVVGWFDAKYLRAAKINPIFFLFLCEKKARCQCWVSQKLCFCLSKSKRCGHFEHPHAFTQFTEVLREFDFRRTSKTGEPGENNKWKYVMRRSFCECVIFRVSNESRWRRFVHVSQRKMRAHARDGDSGKCSRLVAREVTPCAIIIVLWPNGGNFYCGDWTT